MYLQNDVFPILSYFRAGIHPFFGKDAPENVHKIVYYFIYKCAIMCKIAS